jgi:hypothetical protein
LLTHSVPDDVIVSQASPASADLSGLAQRSGVEEAKDFETELWW